MKKKDLERQLGLIASAAGFELVHSGGTKHDKFTLNGHIILIPRHREINEMTAKAILKQAKSAVGEGSK